MRTATMGIRYLLLVLLLAKCCLSGTPNGPVVSTSLGGIEGSMMTSVNGRDFFAFRKIPYAKPPINDLRFEDPVDVEPWTEILDGTSEGPQCIQLDRFSSGVIGSEDCLYLNVYTHDVESTGSKRPVMIWIHGGAFYMGSGNGETDMYGPGILLDRDIVLVTINYRLGALGFLSTEDSVAPGNYGLLDQQMALRWVKKNIEAFGGDSNSITIFGESAGGASVEYQVLSNRSQGLFHRAIAQSGSPLCSWALSDTVKHYTTKLALYLNCPVSSSESMIKCLKMKDAAEITAFRKEIQTIGFVPVAFTPRVDKERKEPFIGEHPRDLLQSGKFNHVPFMTGVTKNEGAIIVASLTTSGGLKKLDDDPEAYLPGLLNMQLLKDSQQKSLELLRYYLKGETVPSANPVLLEQMLSDVFFMSGVHESALLHAKHNRAPTYAYLYAHQGEISFTKLMGGTGDLGVGHGDELPLQFTSSMFGNLKNEDDKKVSQILLDFWTSLAANGFPTSQTSETEWLPAADNMKYMLLQTHPVLVDGAYPFSERVSFMEKILAGEDVVKTEL